MKKGFQNISTVKRIMVGTDRSETAEQAVKWAASLAESYQAELFVVQVLAPENPGVTEYGKAERTRAQFVEEELAVHARQLAGTRGHGLVVIASDPAIAIVSTAEQEKVDVLVVGNIGMAGRKEFLLDNVPNRISHNAHCTVVIVRTTQTDNRIPNSTQTIIRDSEPAPSEPRLIERGSQIAVVMAKHGLKELFGHRDEEGSTDRRRHAKRLRMALEELGPTFSKLGQVLSTRPDLLPPEYIEELENLQDHVPPMSEEEVVGVFEQEMGVPWEDVFESIESKPLAAGTIAQVHRATLVSGDRIVVKTQRPTARNEIEQDLGLLKLFAEKVHDRPALKKVIDMEAVFEHLSSSLHRELDFRQEAANIDRMRKILKGYDCLDVPSVHRDLSTSRILVMEEIQGSPLGEAPEGPQRAKAARQLLECYYKQILVDGFFHADPHPGNLMWWKDRIYFLDFGMVGDVGTDIREHLTLLTLAFWHGDATFLTEVTLMLSEATDRSDLDFTHFQAEIGELMAKYRTVALAEMQIGEILQQMCEIALRHEVPIAASLTLIGKALAQVQMVTARLDPTLDPFDIAGRFLMRTMLKGIRTKLDPKLLLYQSQKLSVRATRVIESVERLIGARPGAKLEVKFRADKLENTVRHTGHRVAIGLTAAASLMAAGITAGSAAITEWVSIGFGLSGTLLTLGLITDALRQR